MATLDGQGGRSDHAMAEAGATQRQAPVSAGGRRIAWAWLWVALCVGVIWGFSGETFSAGGTSRILTPLLRWIYPEIDYQQLRSAHFFVRKCAHLTEYAVLALLAARALRITLDLSLLRIALLTLLLVLAVSGVDEARQAVLPTRTGSFADVALDFVGGAVGVALIVAFHRWLGVGAPVARPPEGA